MTALFADNATSVLVGVYNAAATSFTVNAGDGALFPQPGTNTYFMAVIEDRTQSPIAREIVKVTGRLGDVMTVTRAQEGTTALAWTAGVVFANRVTAGSLTSLRTDAIAGQHYYGSAPTSPTISPAGTSVAEGDMYWDTAFKTIYVFEGGEWTDSQAVSPGDRTVTGNQSVGGNQLVVGSATVEGSIGIEGAASIGGAVTITGDLLVMDVDTQTNTVNGTNTVLGTSTFMGNLGVVGSATIEGGIAAAGNATIGGGVGMAGSAQVGGNMSVAGTISAAALLLDGDQVATASDVSGNFLSQLMPTGNVFQWGSDGTDGSAEGTGTVRVTFPFPMPNTTRAVFVQMVIPGLTPVVIVFQVFAVDAEGFTVLSIDARAMAPVNNVAFTWFAIGQ